MTEGFVNLGTCGCMWIGPSRDDATMKLYDYRLPKEHQYVGMCEARLIRNQPAIWMPHRMWFDTQWITWLACPGEEVPIGQEWWLEHTNCPPLGYFRWVYDVAGLDDDPRLFGEYIRAEHGGRRYVWALVGPTETEGEFVDHIPAVWKD